MYNKYEITCPACDTHFVIVTESDDPIGFCSFCGEPIEVENEEGDD